MAMHDFFLGMSVLMCVLVMACLYRGLLGPGFLNRIVAINVIGSKIVVILAFMGFIYNRIDMFVDISLAYALLNFVGTLTAAKYLERKGIL